MVSGKTTHPEKVGDFEDWITRVRFKSIDSSSETKRFLFDSAAQTVAVGSCGSFIEIR